MAAGGAAVTAAPPLRAAPRDCDQRTTDPPSSGLDEGNPPPAADPHNLPRLPLSLGCRAARVHAMSLREVYNRHCHTARQERALLSAIGFTSTFTAARLITHSIRAGIGPFHNISGGGRHIHHSTFGIFGLLGIGYLWTYRVGVGNKMPEWESRLTASAYGVAAALTLDEFALWLDLHDDYWDKQGRKSIDAVAVFGGLLTIGVAGRDMINELGLLPKRVSKLVERDQHRRETLRQAH